MTWKMYQRPSESADSDPQAEEKAPAGETETVEAAAPAEDPITRLQAELEAAKAESDQWRDRFLRKAAEFDNYRKRTEKDRAESVMLAKSSILAEFLLIADACERALDSFKEAPEEQEGLQQYREGVQLLYKQLCDTLNRIGVVPIEAEGQKFDPHIHEALIREDALEHEEDTVIRELRRGYLFKDRLLRPAQVAVATRAQENSALS